MAPNFWNSLDNINWKRLWLCVFAVSGAFGCFSFFAQDKLYILVTGVLSGVSVGLGILIRGSKYIKDRNEIPQIPGVPI